MTPEAEPCVEPSFLGDYLPYLLNRLAREMLRGVDAEFADRGLTVSKWRILAVLSDKKTCRFGELIKFTNLEPATLSRFVGGLDDAGLIRRWRPKNNGRTVQITLTEQGAAAFEATLPWARDVERRLLRDLSASDVKLLRRMLTKMFVNVSGTGLSDQPSEAVPARAARSA